MLQRSQLREVPSWMTLLLIILMTAAVAFLISRFPTVVAALLSAGIVLLYIGIGFLLFRHGILLNLVYVPMVVIFTFLVITGVDFIEERFLKQKVESAFGKYVSPDLLAMIARDGVKLGGERRDLTILFSDIRGFTGISERLSPEDLVEFLNGYFTTVTKIVMDEHGLVDKFMGDGMMAFWNAPIKDEHHAQHAVEAALRMRHSLELLRKEHGDVYKHLAIGIGINTGDAIVGNVGSEDRLSYTAIGDSVNLASRLESLTKEYGVQIVISESTRRKIKGVVVRELDRVRVKGKKDAARIYEVIGISAHKEELESIKQYEAALEFYYAGNWTEAAARFAKLHDSASKLLLSRCEEFIKHPQHWDGAFEMKHK
jgi:adenylate cyclase